MNSLSIEWIICHSSSNVIPFIFWFITTMACKVLLRSNYCLSAEDVESNKVNHDFNMKMLSHDINMSRLQSESNS